MRSCPRRDLRECHVHPANQDQGQDESRLTAASSAVPGRNGRARAADSGDRPAGVYIYQALVSSAFRRRSSASGRTRGCSLRPERPGYRVFAPQDIERLRHIRDLIQRDGLNAAGARRLLSSTGAENGGERPRSLPVGERIRRQRRRRGLSLRAVAWITGLSPSSISAVERGLSSPTVGSLPGSPSPSRRPSRH